MTPSERAEVLLAIRQVASSLSSMQRSSHIQGGSSYWSAGYHLNIRLYEKLLCGVFDILDEGQLIEECSEWNEWQATVLQERNLVENVYSWVCGRPTSLHDRNRDSDEDDTLHDRDYDVTALANNLSQSFRYNVYDNEECEEGHGTLGQDNKEGYFDDESAEVKMMT